MMPGAGKRRTSNLHDAAYSEGPIPMLPLGCSTSMLQAANEGQGRRCRPRIDLTGRPIISAMSTER